MKTARYLLAATLSVASLSLLAGCAGGGNPSVSPTILTLGSQTRAADPYPHYFADTDAIPNSYIVMLKDGATGGGASARVLPPLVCTVE